ncbi:MAG: Inositol-1-monophosphatase [Chlamydiae bacterium]|nr:Inositol-1-monophosphatase [Chlamydiota bacterium]
MTFSDLTQVAIQAALEAGELLSEGFGTTFQISLKDEKHNLVTEYDIASEKLIIDRIKSHFPSHQFLAEERGAEGEIKKETLWIIDPLDGTVNFAHGIPLFSVSIAVAQGKEILSGVVYNPMNGELFVAEKGQGAQLNGHKISVTKNPLFEKALFATGFPYNVHENPLNCIDRFGKMVGKGLPIRRLGVASLDLAYVAAGRFDAFWEVSLEPWDMAAGKLLIEEAGGKVSHYDGSAHSIYGYLPLLATNGLLHDEMVALLKEDLS